MTKLPTVLMTLVVIIASFDTSNGSNILHKRSVTPSMEINPARARLLKEALGWMTLRKNGVLMNDMDLKPLFLDTIMEKYQSSKLYRTFVIAFENGVLPRLVLSENQACDPKYTWKFKDPWNSSVTWHYLKQFTFENYDNRSAIKAIQYCNYTQGLICRQMPSGTGLCKCPDDSTMQPISTTSKEQRCQLNLGKICSLIDLAHGNDQEQHVLAKNLPQMIFNLEKPLSCEPGTECRFKSDDINTPRCHYINTTFYPPPGVTWTLELGAECALGLFADPGMCQVNTGQYGQLPGLVCYNLGHPGSPNVAAQRGSNRTGFCLPEFGPFGLAKLFSLTNNQLHFHPMFMAFVHPRNVPLKGRVLFDYYKTLQDEVYYPILTRQQQDHEGKWCSVQKTREMYSLWTFYSALDTNKYYGDFHFNATEIMLTNSLQMALNLTQQPSLKICKVYRDYYKTHPDTPAQPRPALECVPQPKPDEHGNDGKCKVSYFRNRDTSQFAEKFQSFLDITSAILAEQHNEDLNYRNDILLAFPEFQCFPTLDPPPSSNTPTDLLQAGYCIEGYKCVEDYGDYHGIYNSSCGVNASAVKLKYSCKEMSDEAEYGECEAKLLDKKIEKRVNRLLESRPELGIGENCSRELEGDIRYWILDGGKPTINKYKLLATLKEEWKEGDNNVGFCATTRLLECTNEKKCGCKEGTKQRESHFNGKTFLSDYCYLTAGSCQDRDVTQYAAATTAEKDKLWKHYGDPFASEDLCKDEMGNLCAFKDELRQVCTGGDKEIIPMSGGGKGKDQGESGESHFVKGGAGHLRGNCWIITGGNLVFNLVIIMNLFNYERFQVQNIP